jgi:hypothetical protein
MLEKTKEILHQFLIENLSDRPTSEIVAEYAQLIIANNASQRKNIKRVWYILDEIAVKCSAKHMGKPSCPICDRAIEAMKLCPEKPNHQECLQLYEERLHG